MLFFCKFSGFDSVGVKKEEDLRTKPIQLLFPRVVKRLVLNIPFINQIGLLHKKICLSRYKVHTS
ncbi:MAG: hypothetical protein RLZZ203_2423 [Cyanobacteriota bacterium]